MILDPISDLVLNSSSPLKIKSPTPSCQHDKTLSISHVMPSSKPNINYDVDESDSETISYMLMNFTRNKIIPRAFVLEEPTINETFAVYILQCDSTLCILR